ncbi:PadR family transcriptional regulator [Kineococcus glutinatus]|uniref:PadR family transcriptional regulator n=1 Tax=Kineococcus glutinatus TaxID=1070872 RepID=A0ABP8VE25_9ACTN
MARRSQTELAVLGALSVAPATGYGVRAAVRDTLGHFWHESFGQIYPTLAALESAGLVERLEPGAGASPFRITAAGLQRLRELLLQPGDPLPPRDPLLLRLFFGRHVGDDVLRGWLREALAQAEQAQARYDALRAQVEQELTSAPDARYWLLTVTAGQHRARAGAEWAREALQLLERAPAPGPPAPGPPAQT